LQQEYQQQHVQHQQQQTTAATVAALAHELPPGALTSFAGMATDFATVLYYRL
jgi:nitrogen-specific signal transduction histidine kinase